MVMSSLLFPSEDVLPSSSGVNWSQQLALTDDVTAVPCCVQAFRALPQPVRAKLAKSCQAVSLPAGAVVFEEDQKGDAMFVVLSGSCQVRARPLAEPGQADTAAAAVAAVTEGLQGLQLAAGASGSGQQQHQQQQRRSTVEVAALGGSSSGGIGLRGSGAAGARRTTWEGAAFTAQEQARLEAVKAALDANKQQVSSKRGNCCCCSRWCNVGSGRLITVIIAICRSFGWCCGRAYDA